MQKSINTQLESLSIPFIQTIHCGSELRVVMPSLISVNCSRVSFVTAASISAAAILHCARCHRLYHLLNKPCGDLLVFPCASLIRSRLGDLQHHCRDMPFPTPHVYPLAPPSIRFLRNASIPELSRVLPSDELPGSRLETLSRALACVSSSVVIHPPLTLPRSHSQ